MLSVVMLNDIMLSVVMLNVVVPKRTSFFLERATIRPESTQVDPSWVLCSKGRLLTLTLD